MAEGIGIGASVVITGELSAKEDLTIDGQVDGKVELGNHVLTIGPTGRVKAEVLVKTVIVRGRIKGNITAADAIHIRDTATVEGKLVAPKMSIAEGASVRGRIDMRPSQQKRRPRAAA